MSHTPAFSRIEGRPRTVRPSQAGNARVLTFTRPEGNVLSRVEADCAALRIPTYKEAERAHWDVMVRFWGQQDIPTADAACDRAWQKLGRQLGVDRAVFDRWRDTNADYKQWRELREANVTTAAYLLGLYVARREYPKLGGGVL